MDDLIPVAVPWMYSVVNVLIGDCVDQARSSKKNALESREAI